jgi:hypothetical protein
LGSGIYAHWPRLVAETARRGLSFVALVNLIDQTFIGAYKEELVRACRFGDALGCFVTCEEFFTLTANVPRHRTRYAWDDYVFDLEFPKASYHRYESGGFSTTIEHWRGVVEEMKGRQPTAEEWHRVLDGEAHDVYLLPHFKTGAFLGIYLTDYPGPRYRVTVDERYGVTRFIRDAVGFPKKVWAALPVPMEGDAPVEVDAQTGGVIVAGRMFGALASTRGPSRVLSVEPGSVTRVGVRIAAVGDFTLRYWSYKGTVYGLVERPSELPWFRHEVPYWQDCVYLRHAHGERGLLPVRWYVGLGEPTRLPEFYSRERLTIGRFELLHGGNGFFRIADAEAHNRLWCHNESAQSFWWAVRQMPEGHSL